MTDKLYPIREYKATVFATLFDSRPELLSLYNAVNGSHYDDPEKLTINTLEQAIYMGYKKELPVEEAEFEYGRSVGMEKGQALGELSGKAAFIVELLEETGPVPEWLRARIGREKDREILSQWHRTAAKVGTVEEFVRQTGLEQEFADKHGNEKDYING